MTIQFFKKIYNVLKTCDFYAIENKSNFVIQKTCDIYTIENFKIQKTCDICTIKINLTKNVWFLNTGIL